MKSRSLLLLAVVVITMAVVLMFWLKPAPLEPPLPSSSAPSSTPKPEGVTANPALNEPIGQQARPTEDATAAAAPAPTLAPLAESETKIEPAQAAPQYLGEWGKTLNPASDCKFSLTGNRMVITVPGTER